MKKGEEEKDETTHPAVHSPGRTRIFLTGLLTVIPLGVTVFVLVYLVKLLSAIGKYPTLRLKEFVGSYTDLDAKFLSSPWFIDSISVLLVLILIYFLGIMTNNFLGRRIIQLFEAILARIPLVKTIYGAVKKLVDLLQHDTDSDVQRVVLIDFPSPEMKTVGLVTRTFADASTGMKLAAVYVPTTPNPTSGYLEIVPVKNLVATNWTFDEAMTFIVSGGAMAPDKLHYVRPPADAGPVGDAKPAKTGEEEENEGEAPAASPGVSPA